MFRRLSKQCILMKYFYILGNRMLYVQKLSLLCKHIFHVITKIFIFPKSEMNIKITLIDERLTNFNRRNLRS